MNKSIFLFTCATAGMLLTPFAASAQCPSGDPLQVLVANWTFQAKGVAPILYKSAGQFTASIVNGRGFLAIVQTLNNGVQIIRQERDIGSYQINSTCSGGTLVFNLSTGPIAFDFWFLEGRTELYFVSINSGLPVVGGAELQNAVVPTGSCQPSSSLSVLVTPPNVVAYVPKGSWSVGTTGVVAVNVEGTSITNTTISTPNAVNSCASSPSTGKTVCTANNTDVYVITGTTLGTTRTSGAAGSLSFSGGSCTNCGVAMDDTHQRAAIALSTGTPGVGGFQFLDLTNNNLSAVFPSRAPNISEDVLIDGVRNLLLSPSETNNYEIIDVTSNTPPASAFFERGIAGVPGELDSAGEDCSTGIALASIETGSNQGAVFITDLTQATFTPGAPGTWTAPSQIQSLTGSVLQFGASGMAIAQGSTHTGVLAGEFGGDAITAIRLPATPGGSPPAVQAWLTCSLAGFTNGRDPHTVTAYESPASGHAIALLADATATHLAVVDLTLMLALPSAGNVCTGGPLTSPSAVYTLMNIP
jgi:hypothetical protein